MRLLVEVLLMQRNDMMMLSLVAVISIVAIIGLVVVVTGSDLPDSSLGGQAFRADCWTPEAKVWVYDCFSSGMQGSVAACYESWVAGCAA